MPLPGERTPETLAATLTHICGGADEDETPVETPEKQGPPETPAETLTYICGGADEDSPQHSRGSSSSLDTYISRAPDEDVSFVYTH